MLMPRYYQFLPVWYSHMHLLIYIPQNSLDPLIVPFWLVINFHIPLDLPYNPYFYTSCKKVSVLTTYYIMIVIIVTEILVNNGLISWK